MRSLAENGYEVSKVNLLLSMAHDCEEDELISLKYKSVAIVEYLRSKNKIDEAGCVHDKPPGAQLPVKD